MINLNAETTSIILAALLALSELLSLIPQVKSNGVAQIIFNLIRRMAGKG